MTDRNKVSSDVSGSWFYTLQREGRVRGELNLPSSMDWSDGGETMAEGRGCSKNTTVTIFLR